MPDTEIMNPVEKIVSKPKPIESTPSLNSREKAWYYAAIGGVIGALANLFITGSKTPLVEDTKLRTKYWQDIFIGNAIGAVAGYLVGKASSIKNESETQKEEALADSKSGYSVTPFMKWSVGGALASSGVSFLLNKTGVYDKLGWDKKIQGGIYSAILTSSWIVPVVKLIKHIRNHIKIDKFRLWEEEQHNADIVKEALATFEKQKNIPATEQPQNVSDSKYVQNEENRRTAYSKIQNVIS